MGEADQVKYGLDLLDPTKLVPEELVPVRRVGKMVLDRNPQNFFAETEQAAFHVGNLVPGIEVTSDPLMQGRLFSYLDTQLTRLGGPNFAEIPINKPLARVANHQQDGFHRDTIDTGANYHPNSVGSGCPFLAGTGPAANRTGFVHRSEALHGTTSLVRSESFRDHFSQATLFYASQSPAEQRHLIRALRFELGKVTRVAIRARMLRLLAEVDRDLAEQVSDGIGVAIPTGPVEVPPGTSAPGPRTDNGGITVSPALSLANQPRTSIATRKICPRRSSRTRPRAARPPASRTSASSPRARRSTTRLPSGSSPRSRSTATGPARSPPARTPSCRRPRDASAPTGEAGAKHHPTREA